MWEFPTFPRLSKPSVTQQLAYRSIAALTAGVLSAGVRSCVDAAACILSPPQIKLLPVIRSRERLEDGRV